MIKTLKHITAVLLLLIFPISAIGFNISVHKCKHSGSFHFSFFANLDSKNNLLCCCSVLHVVKTEKPVKKSCCHKEVVQVKVRDCCKNKHTKNTDLITKFNPTTENNIIASNISTEKANPETNNFGLNIHKKSCCSNSNQAYIININYTSTENDKLIQDSPLNFDIRYQNISNSTKNFDKFSNKELKYPLKEPVCHIISFIHNTFQTGDDAAPACIIMLSQIA